MSLQAESKSYI